MLFPGKYATMNPNQNAQGGVSYGVSSGSISHCQKRIAGQTHYRPYRVRPGDGGDSSAGQFAHLKAEGLFLRRPISICEIDREKGTLRFVFEIKGEGTRVLSEKRVGDNLDIMGPLGHGFAGRKGKSL